MKKSKVKIHALRKELEAILSNADRLAQLSDALESLAAATSDEDSGLDRMLEASLDVLSAIGAESITDGAA